MDCGLVACQFRPVFGTVQRLVDQPVCLTSGDRVERHHAIADGCPGHPRIEQTTGIGNALGAIHLADPVRKADVDHQLPEQAFGAIVHIEAGQLVEDV